MLLAKTKLNNIEVSFAVGIKICAITAGIKNHKSIIKKKKKKHDKIVLLAKTKLNNIEVLISTASIDSCISHDEFFSVNKVLREYDNMKKEIKNIKTLAVNQRFKFIYETMLSYCLT